MRGDRHEWRSRSLVEWPRANRVLDAIVLHQPRDDALREGESPRPTTDQRCRFLLSLPVRRERWIHGRRHVSLAHGPMWSLSDLGYDESAGHLIDDDDLEIVT